MSDLTDSELDELERELDATLDDGKTLTAARLNKLDQAFAELRRHRNAGQLRASCAKEDNATPVVMVSNARQRIAEALQDSIEEFEAACKERDRARRDRDYYRAALMGGEPLDLDQLRIPDAEEPGTIGISFDGMSLDIVDRDPVNESATFHLNIANARLLARALNQWADANDAGVKKP